MSEELDKEFLASQNEVKEAKDLIPAMNINLPTENKEDDKLISGESVLNVFDEILVDLKNNTDEIDGFISNFSESVINQGDATSSSKEALVNLIKLKSDMSDKKTKVAELMTRIFMKERDTFPRYLAASQKNTIHVGKQIDRRSLIEQVKKEENNKNE